MLRVIFTPDDIGRVRMAADPDPMWETVYSVFRLMRPGQTPIFGAWRDQVVRHTRRADLDILLPLVRGAYYPDFLTPAEGRLGLPYAIEALLATPAARLRQDMTELARLGEPTPWWMRRLAEGDRAVLERVAAAMRSHHEVAVAPFWPDAQAHVEADRARRARALLDHGVEGLLESFRPMMRWSSPVLEVDTPFEQTIALDGRGLVLIPSYFSWGAPDVLRDPDLPPVLVYPVERDPALFRAASPATNGGSVAALIGQTRTSVLESIGDGSTTSELARRVGVSAASVSQHTAVLREARLIQTSRVGKAVLHTITPLGAALLGDRPAEDAAARRRPA
ncbi:winged helix-turn-helix domain-containing protein [Actinoplanes sp. KI2]|uniref:ArsR/SmtB family transcription factor n=1 Tax=Actinoplanes sp. KI2 TaxID=2983315 RepID=UPI0021D58969|nr:winged helix-turn-helix domain-containing protein [Actinoplanes sp. KI2]MCU7725962.1 winged helix-turn-helix domain-containing protein [Actinoplanes sp. KI2]